MHNLQVRDKYTKFDSLYLCVLKIQILTLSNIQLPIGVIDILRRLKNEIFRDNPSIQEILPASQHAFNKAIKHGIARSLLKERNINWLKQHGKRTKITPYKAFTSH